MSVKHVWNGKINFHHSRSDARRDGGIQRRVSHNIEILNHSTKITTILQCKWPLKLMMEIRKNMKNHKIR